MWIFISLFAGTIAGAIATYLALEPRRLALNEQKRHQEEKQKTLDQLSESLKSRKSKIDEVEIELLAHAESRELECKKEIDSKLALAREQALRIIGDSREEANAGLAKLQIAQTEFDSRLVSYNELREENTILKRDLSNINMNVRKQNLDVEQIRKSQLLLDERSQELATRFLKDNVNWISENLTANNFANCKQRLQKVIDWCREINFDIPTDRERQLHSELKKEYELAVRAALEREEQTRIRAQIREEQKREREIERELQKLENERTVIEAALSKALAQTKNQHNEEIERLQRRLEEAEQRTERVKSQAQLTRAGHIYIISNIGSFGQGVFKIGMTRRLEPHDRIRELGDASVPFPFDIHMVIGCEDAPKLENIIHKCLHKHRLNRANPRKEFFRAELEEIRKIVETHHGVVEYKADAVALEYNQSLSMSEEDQEYIESVFDDGEDGPESIDDSDIGRPPSDRLPV